MARFQEFRRLAEKLPVVSLADLETVLPGLRRETLYRWRKSGYINMVAPGFYVLADSIKTEQDLFAIASRLYTPSFVSLESALAWYGLIPETPLAVTSVTTRKTRTVSSEIGEFIYRTVKPACWFGYSIEETQSGKFMIARPERAITDLLYLRRDLKTPGHFIELRLNEERLGPITGDLLETAGRFQNRMLLKRCHMLLEVVEHAGS
ncbi:MAG: hypothetical protein JXK93_02095 [Sphaerochaetaceae bacterium]|nr:hypothetical protein [Sphaerochaetaceae bacterium]